MNNDLIEKGYSIHRGVVSDEVLNRCREEADYIANEAKSSCVRHLRERSLFFNELALSPEFNQLLPLGLRPVRSILFDKNKDENWAVPWHQDLTIAVKSKIEIAGYEPWSMKDGYPHVQPPFELLNNMVTIRLHLDDTPVDNGALRVIPESHCLGKLPSAEVMNHVNDSEVCCECGAGDVLLMKPLVLHASRKSKLLGRRRVVHIEYAFDSDLASGLNWAE